MMTVTFGTFAREVVAPLVPVKVATGTTSSAAAPTPTNHLMADWLTLRFRCINPPSLEVPPT